MRNYLYISDAKVDSYLPQIGNATKRRVAARLGFDVKVLQASLQTEWVSLEDRVRRLEVVEEEVLRTKDVGSIAGPLPWIEASSDVAAAAFRGNVGLTFFFSRTEDQFPGLAGSKHHVVGNLRSADAAGGFSHVHALLSAIEDVISTDPLVTKAEPELSGLSHDPDYMARPWMVEALASRFDRWPKQRAHFLARRLTRDEIGPNGKRCTLATPLYIALEDVS